MGILLLWALWNVTFFNKSLISKKSRLPGKSLLFGFISNSTSTEDSLEIQKRNISLEALYRKFECYEVVDVFRSILVRKNLWS